MNKKRMTLLFILISSCFVSTSWSCCRPDDDYASPMDYSSDHYSGFPASFQTLSTQESFQKLKTNTSLTQKRHTLQSLIAISCAAFVKNNLETIEHQLNFHLLPNDNNSLKCMFTSALALPSEDSKRLYKIITILKKMPLELYGDLAFLINQYPRISHNPTDERRNNEERNILYGLLQYLPNPIEDARVKTIEFFKADYRHCTPALSFMIHNAVRVEVPYQVMKVLLNNGADHNNDNIIGLIPHPRYSKITNKDSENALEKLKLVLELKTSKKQKLNDTARKFISFLNEWSIGDFNCLNCPTWHRLGEPITMQEIEEIEENKQFLIDAITLIEDYEKMEAEEKENQILPF
jgi:hypothetical protein